MSSDRILIDGIGIISPVGIGIDALRESLARGLDPKAVGEIDVTEYLSSSKTYLDPNSAYSLSATALAIKDAGLIIDDKNSPTIGMSFGTRFGNVATTEKYLDMIREQGVKLASPLLFIHSYPNTSVSLSAIEFGIRGTSYNFTSGRQSGLEAVIQSADELSSSRMSVMLAGSADTYTEVTQAGANGRPFAAAATLVLRRSQADRPFAEIAGCGLSSSAEAALERALRRASIDAADVDWLLVDSSDNAGGYDGPSLDKIRAGGRVTRLTEVIGDCGSATAVLGVALASVTMADGTIPAGLGLAESPRTAAVLSADECGAAAVVLRKFTD